MKSFKCSASAMLVPLLFSLHAAAQAADPEFSGSVTGVFQNLNHGQTSTDAEKNEFNARADFELEWSPSDNHLFFGHIRSGKGNGISPQSSTFTGGLNSTAFHLDRNTKGSGSTVVLFAQAWYQYSNEGFKATVGKIDPFVFFDNNEYADDESGAFLNNVFVHNPLLDSGGDIGADGYGFTPGGIASWSFGSGDEKNWTIQAGVFGRGNGQNFHKGLNNPFLITQLQYEGNALLNHRGIYQLYTWRNPQAEHAVTGAFETHEGFGLSFTQEITDSVGVFSRLGTRTKGEGGFNQVATLGVQVKGNLWGRENDHIGLAVGGLKAGKAWRDAGNASGTEKNAELYYSWQFNEHLTFSPVLQWVGKPAGVKNEPSISVLGLRAKVSF